MYIIGTILFCLNLCIALASNCENLSGLWQNQLGSNMTILYRTDNHITGEYSTAVESKMRAALVTSNLTGIHIPVDGGALVSFSVLFNHGKSLTTWVGQCMECDGEETLFTTWALRSHLHKPVDRWMSVRIHQDTFQRVKGDDSIIPFHLRTLGPARKDGKSMECEKNIQAGVGGHWVSERSNSLQFNDCYESGIFSGVNEGKDVIGRTDGGGPFTALGFVSASTESITGWTGHIHESPTEKRTIEASWMSHEFSNSCKDPRRLLRFGMENYTFSYLYEEPKKEKESRLNNILRFFSSWI
ncbi:uncharacterized protein LOC129971099 [Argiope bruennichi]|uniref:uncharacterized protein LOC129971099 n=1 Tax=Argiope bruennichi TaxID=94029 RepID=UPI0024959902|nr:uncharacterized protein LOC129971099 [Argiope bruennichi]